MEGSNAAVSYSQKREKYKVDANGKNAEIVEHRKSQRVRRGGIIRSLLLYVTLKSNYLFIYFEENKARRD